MIGCRTVEVVQDQEYLFPGHHTAADVLHKPFSPGPFCSLVRPGNVFFVQPVLGMRRLGACNKRQSPDLVRIVHVLVTYDQLFDHIVKSANYHFRWKWDT